MSVAVVAAVGCGGVEVWAVAGEEGDRLGEEQGVWLGTPARLGISWFRHVLERSCPFAAAAVAVVVVVAVVVDGSAVARVYVDTAAVVGVIPAVAEVVAAAAVVYSATEVAVFAVAAVLVVVAAVVVVVVVAVVVDDISESGERWVRTRPGVPDAPCWPGVRRCWSAS